MMSSTIVAMLFAATGMASSYDDDYVNKSADARRLLTQDQIDTRCMSTIPACNMNGMNTEKCCGMSPKQSSWTSTSAGGMCGCSAASDTRTQSSIDMGCKYAPGACMDTQSVRNKCCQVMKTKMQVVYSTAGCGSHAVCGCACASPDNNAVFALAGLTAANTKEYTTAAMTPAPAPAGEKMKDEKMKDVKDKAGEVEMKAEPTAAELAAMHAMMMKKDAANKQWDKIIASEMKNKGTKSMPKGTMKACGTCIKLTARSKVDGGFGCEQLKMWAQYVGVKDYNLYTKMKGYIFANFDDEKTKNSPQLPMNCRNVYLDGTYDAEGNWNKCNPEEAINVCMKKEGLMEIRFRSPEQMTMNETNETEYEVYVLPTPMPTKPTSQVMVSTKLAGKAADAIPDVKNLAQAMVKSLGANVGATVTATVEYTVTTKFTFADIVPTKDVATKAMADLYKVDPDAVEVTITATRRLRGQQRRLAGATVAAAITVQDAAKVDSLAEKGKDLTKIQAEFAATYVKAHKAVTGQTISEPDVAVAAPEVQMDIKYEIKSTTATAVAIPSPTALKAAFEADGDLKALAATLTLATPAPTAAPTALPAGDTFMPTRAPTFAPETTTMMPVATPGPTMMSPTSFPTHARGTPDPTTMEGTAPTPTPNTTMMAPAPKGKSESGAPSSLRLSVTAAACAIAAVWVQ